ncbi:UPF0481 protein At3g47200-like [Populus nigra]|uniref:UPF0481 protein At3g47200-like n=1 Tax=Populus nigra TaxID=3691 RepID=UPI002B266296|nr:UPF0481 protein At3g47200-like [Populus nigra]
MMLMDSVFIIVIFLINGYEDVNRLFNKPWMLGDIAFDMFLIENHLPFFILEDLFKASEIASRFDEECSVIKLAYKFFKDDWNSLLSTEGILEEMKASEVAHFVDLQAGVKFKLSPSKSLLDMKFDRGILEIPLLRVQDSTEIYFRNLRAFDKCDILDQDHIGDYISMINFLVISPKDVEILVENRIIENWIHDNEAVSTVLHDISKPNDLSQNNSIFAGLV